MMSIDFHHTQPALLVGGDFSGVVYIWDLSKEDDPLVVDSASAEDGHQEPVTKVGSCTVLFVRKSLLVSISQF